MVGHKLLRSFQKTFFIFSVLWEILWLKILLDVWRAAGTAAANFAFDFYSIVVVGGV